MNKTYIFKSLKKNTEQRQKQIFTQNNDCYNTRDLKSVQLLVPYSDTSTTISISLTSFYSTCTNLILVWLLVLIKQILTWSEVWLAVSGTRVRMDLWCLISLFQMKRLKRQELKQNDTVFHCLLRNAQINTIIVQHIRTKTIQSLTYVLTNSNKLYYRQRFTPCIDHGEQFYRYWKTIEQNIKYILSVYSMLLLSRSVQENYQTRTQFLTQSLSRVVLHSNRKTCSGFMKYICTKSW